MQCGHRAAYSGEDPTCSASSALIDGVLKHLIASCAGMTKQATKLNVLPLLSSGPGRGRSMPVANVRTGSSLLMQTAAARLKTAQQTSRTTAGAVKILSAGVRIPSAGLRGGAHMAGAQRALAGQQPERQRPVLGHARRGAGKAAEYGAPSAEALTGQRFLGTPASPEPREGAQQAEPLVRLQISPEGNVSLLVYPQAVSPASPQARVLLHLPGDLARRDAAMTQQGAQVAGIVAGLEPCTEEAGPGRAALMGRTVPCDEAVTCAPGRLKRVPGGDPLQVREPHLPCFTLGLLGLSSGCQHLAC